MGERDRRRAGVPRRDDAGDDPAHHGDALDDLRDGSVHEPRGEKAGARGAHDRARGGRVRGGGSGDRGARRLRPGVLQPHRLRHRRLRAYDTLRPGRPRREREAAPAASHHAGRLGRRPRGADEVHPQARIDDRDAAGVHPPPDEYAAEDVRPRLPRRQGARHASLLVRRVGGKRRPLDSHVDVVRDVRRVRRTHGAHQGAGRPGSHVRRHRAATRADTGTSSRAPSAAPPTATAQSTAWEWTGGRSGNCA